MKDDNGFARTTWEAAQHSVGVSWSQVVSLSGAVVASLWFWTGRRTASVLPSETPWDWGLGAVQSIGVEPGLPLSLTVPDLDQRSWFLLFISASLLLTLPRGSRDAVGAHVSLGTFALLAALSVQPGLSTLLVYLIGSAAPCVFAVALGLAQGRSNERPAEGDYLDSPSLSIQYWLTGPMMVVALPSFLPVIIVVEAVQRYRIERSGISPSIRLVSRVMGLGSTPLKQADAAEVVSCLLAARLLSSDDSELRWAGAMLADPGPRGAQP